MPNVDGKEFPYTKKGKADAKKEAMKSGKKMTKGDKKPKKDMAKKLAGGVGSMAATAMAPKKGAMNNTSAPKPPTPPQAAMGAGPSPSPAPKPPMGAPAGGGMGMPPKKPPMPMMKEGGKVKKKAKSYGHGGKVRGAGIAKKGVRKCKMR